MRIITRRCKAREIKTPTTRKAAEFLPLYHHFEKRVCTHFTSTLRIARLITTQLLVHNLHQKPGENFRNLYSYYLDARARLSATRRKNTRRANFRSLKFSFIRRCKTSTLTSIVYFLVDSSIWKHSSQYTSIVYIMRCCVYLSLSLHLSLRLWRAFVSPTRVHNFCLSVLCNYYTYASRVSRTYLQNTLPFL